MTLVVLSMDIAARSRDFPGDLARSLALKLVDWRPFERDLATRADNLGACGIGVVDLRHRRHNHWEISAQDLAERLEEEITDLSATGDILLVSWIAPCLRVKPADAVIRVKAPKEARAASFQKMTCVPCLQTACLDLESEEALISRFISLIAGARRKSRQHFDCELDEHSTDLSRFASQIRLHATLGKFRRGRENCDQAAPHELRKSIRDSFGHNAVRRR